jgi:hypothetical protein
MGRWRFYRRVSVMPGVRLNFSKSGPSWTFGGRGYHVTVGKHSTRRTVGLPGTGLSWTSYSPHHAKQASRRRTSTASRSRPATALRPNRPPSKPREPMLPVAKIVWGVILIVLGIILLAASIGAVFILAGAIMLIVGLVQRTQPKWKARVLIRAARRDPAHAVDFLDQAVGIDGASAQTLGPAADCHFQNGDWSRAAELLERYLAKAPNDDVARAHLGIAYLNANEPDAAIRNLQTARSAAPLGEEGQHSLTAALSLAFVKRGDPQQALELAKTAPLQRRQLTPALQQCLFVRALSFYFLGQRVRAASDLDRLYAQNPDYPGLLEMKNEVRLGTLTLGEHEEPAPTGVALG